MPSVLIPSGGEGFEWLLASPRRRPCRRWEISCFAVPGAWEFQVCLGPRILEATWNEGLACWEAVDHDGQPIEPLTKATWLKAMDAL